MSTVLILFSAVAGIGGLGGIAGLFFIKGTRAKLGAEARKLGVEADDLISGRAMKMYEVELWEKRRAQGEAEHCRQWRYALEEHVDHQDRIMRDNNIEPLVFTPPPVFVAPPTFPGATE